MYNFCTLFNSNYLMYGLTLYESLKKTCPHFKIFVFAFDDDCADFLKRLNFPEIEIIQLREFEDPQLLEVKSGRSAAEYCWTCTSSTILYVLNNYNVDHCTYVDADLFFFNNPDFLLKEINESSVLISPHNFSSKYREAIVNGKYCVQFMTFKNDPQGLEVLKWWRNSCINWCFNRLEDGKFGDQKYLDDWLDRFDCVKELEHKGAVGPWNVQDYNFLLKNNKLHCNYLPEKKEYEVIFFHFHGLRFVEDKEVDLGGYFLPNEAKEKIYFPYINNLISISKELNISLPKHNQLPFLKKKYSNIKRRFQNCFNIFKVEKIIRWQKL